MATQDGDFWLFDWAEAPDANAPLVVLFHGLEGSSGSHYVRALFVRLAALGWAGVVPHFRGCADEPNRLPRAYHSGDYEEIGAMLAAIRKRVGPERVVHACGVSLGGSALLNWLGRLSDEAVGVIDAAASVCAPLDLHAAGSALSSGFNRLVYTQRFLLTLKPNALAKLRRHPGLVLPERIRAARTLREFDDAVTAPLHGFRGARRLLDAGEQQALAEAHPPAHPDHQRAQRPVRACPFAAHRRPGAAAGDPGIPGTRRPRPILRS